MATERNSKRLLSAKWTGTLAHYQLTSMTQLGKGKGLKNAHRLPQGLLPLSPSVVLAICPAAGGQCRGVHGVHPRFLFGVATAGCLTCYRSPRRYHRPQAVDEACRSERTSLSGLFVSIFLLSRKRSDLFRYLLTPCFSLTCVTHRFTLGVSVTCTTQFPEYR
jgi:hypothetical protein